MYNKCRIARSSCRTARYLHEAGVELYGARTRLIWRRMAWMLVQDCAILTQGLYRAAWSPHEADLLCSVTLPTNPAHGRQHYLPNLFATYLSASIHVFYSINQHKNRLMLPHIATAMLRSMEKTGAHSKTAPAPKHRMSSSMKRPVLPRPFAIYMGIQKEP
jgi:hypothetical protein